MARGAPVYCLPFTVYAVWVSPSIPTSGRILAVDWGQVRLGLAISDESQTIATPLETLLRRAGKRFPMARFLELAGQHRPVGLVVGLPLSPEGTDNESALAARELADALTRRTNLPLELWDERMSTARALAAVREQGGSTRGRKADVDALAAAILLQHFMDARRNRAGRAEGAEEAEGAEGSKPEAEESES